MITARTDVVGSLLRPREFLEARKRLKRGETGRPEFKWVEDAAVEAAMKVTLPSPGLFANFYDPQRARGAKRAAGDRDQTGPAACPTRLRAN